MGKWVREEDFESQNKSIDFIIKAVGNDGNMQIWRGNLEVMQNASDMMQPS